MKKSIKCPTCGSECDIEEGTTHAYMPIKKYSEEEVVELLRKWTVIIDTFGEEFMKKTIDLYLNKKNG
jgi:hypothetical protein